MSKLLYEKVSEKQLHPYPQAKGIYANNFNILNKKELESLEREITSVRQAELISDISTIIKITIPQYLYNFKTFTMIHQRLFSDLYPWAGKIRDFDMSYDGHIFTNYKELVFYGEKVFNEFRTHVEQGFEDQTHFIKESAKFLNLINTLHPFPDGNGRTQRNIINIHFNYHGFELNWNNIHQWEVYETLKQSFEGNIEPLIDMLKKHLKEL
ncbi:Fic family protein [Thiomicrorhabdus sp. Milos-T2]|uniref:Fic/DOC family protein n=1 Tax=Thiomicrorhabdus sp. Milos-T2 TaxID=90814 RepID=UPI000493CDBF|nr:Fic family protein [Thiomicrorhabdus sp. Milos-T2]